MTLLAGALTLPGLALADRGGGYGHEEDHHHKHHSQWRHRDYGHNGRWGYDRRVVVREPLYVEPRRPVAVPFWSLPRNGVTVILRNDW